MLTKAAIDELVGMGYTTMEFKATSGSPFLCFYSTSISVDYLMNQDIATFDGEGGAYFASGSVVKIDLTKLQSVATDEVALKWVLTSTSGWTAYEADVDVIFSDFVFGTESTDVEESPDTAKEAFNLLAAINSYSAYNYGTPTGVSATKNTVTVTATAGPSGFTGFNITKQTVSKWLELGYTYFEFKLEANAPYACLFSLVLTPDFLVNQEDATIIGDGAYFASGSVIKINLETLYACANSDTLALEFAFCTTNSWSAYGDNVSATFSDIKFA